MSQKINTSLKLSGEDECSKITYSLEKYLENDGGVTERLLKAFNHTDVVSRAERVRDKVEVLAQEIIQSYQSSS
ncbi:hypothetical protein MFIFM68171_03058 [Madurella fahalii]|uniref:Uncharacterized protein n=1 Tax=Madurella fahalii TaxID=1157608 RepID=A0ABQ0G502_9PEZI